jgi:hypothetical protein
MYSETPNVRPFEAAMPQNPDEPSEISTKPSCPPFSFHVVSIKLQKAHYPCICFTIY